MWEIEGTNIDKSCFIKSLCNGIFYIDAVYSIYSKALEEKKVPYIWESLIQTDVWYGGEGGSLPLPIFLNLIN